MVLVFRSFCNLFTIGKHRVEKLAEKVVSGALIAGDERGRRINRPHAIQEEWKAKVHEHINSIPQRQSHYSFAGNRKKEYLPAELSISRLYNMYLEKYEPQTKDSRVKPHVSCLLCCLVTRKNILVYIAD